MLVSHSRVCIYPVQFSTAVSALNLLCICPALAPTRRHTRATAARPSVFVPPHVVATTATYWMRSFIPSMTIAWNSLPTSVQQDKNIRSFKTSVNNLSLDHSFLSNDPSLSHGIFSLSMSCFGYTYICLCPTRVYVYILFSSVPLSLL